VFDARAQIVQIFLIDHGRLNLALFLANLLRQIIDRRANLLDLLVPEFDGVNHDIFGDLFCTGLDHHDAFRGTDNHQVQVARALLFVGRVNDELAIHTANTHRTDWSVERNVRYAQRNRRAVDAGDVRIILGVSREHHGDDLGLATEAFREQRTDRTVDLAAGQNFALAGTSFALDEAARNASGSVGVLAVIDGEREEVDAFARLRICAGGGQNHVVAHANDAGAVGLLG